MRKKHGFSSGVVANDMTSNALLGFISLFVLAFTLINLEKAKKDQMAPTDGKFMIVIQWPDGSADDVDLHVGGPDGKVVYFRSREIGLMHLERDDLGSRNDIVDSATGEVKVDKNEERVILRGIVDGEYIVNAHMYHKGDADPTKVTARLVRMKGAEEIVKKERTLAANGDEATFFRFTLDAREQPSDINELPKSFTGGESSGGAEEGEE